MCQRIVANTYGTLTANAKIYSKYFTHVNPQWEIKRV